MNIWLQHWQRKPRARMRLFCFPYAGGSASIFRSWANLLPSEIEVCPVQLPGRENRRSEKPFRHITPLIETLTQVLTPYLDLPYAFFGHSMGTLIAFELAHRIHQEGKEVDPVHLFMSGHRAPHLPDPDPPTYHLPDASFVSELRRLQGTPEEILQHAELLQMFLPLLRADFEMCETYQYTTRPSLLCPLSAFCGLQDTEVSREELSAWRIHTGGIFKLRFFVGDHFYLHAQHPALLQALAQDLFYSQRATFLAH